MSQRTWKNVFSSFASNSIITPTQISGLVRVPTGTWTHAEFILYSSLISVAFFFSRGTLIDWEVSLKTISLILADPAHPQLHRPSCKLWRFLNWTWKRTQLFSEPFFFVVFLVLCFFFSRMDRRIILDLILFSMIKI